MVEIAMVKSIVDSYGNFLHGYERESTDFQPAWIVYFIEHVETTKL